MSLVNLQIRVDQARISRAITNLRRATNPALLDSLPLTPEMNRAKGFLLSIFPVSAPGTRSPGSKAETQALGVPGHLAKGWQIRTVVTEHGIGFSLVHKQSSNSRVKQILEALDQGTKSGTRAVGSTIVFRAASSAGAKRYVTLVKDRMLVYENGTKGIGYVQKTFNYVVANLVPVIKDKARKLVRKAYRNE